MTVDTNRARELADTSSALWHDDVVCDMLRSLADECDALRVKNVKASQQIDGLIAAAENAMEWRAERAHLVAVADAARKRLEVWTRETYVALKDSLAALDAHRAGKACPPHDWDRDGERCRNCGDKDWMT